MMLHTKYQNTRPVIKLEMFFKAIVDDARHIIYYYTSREFPIQNFHRQMTNI